MNILYRQLSELTVNEISFEKRLEFYQTHYYDNIYFISDCGKYLGFKSYQTEIQGKKLLCEPIQLGLSTESVYRCFLNNPGVHRIPAIQDDILCGEYYDASLSGKILYKDIEDRALALFPEFKDDIYKSYAGKRIGVLGDSITNILPILSTAEQYNNGADYDLLVDTNIIPQFRRLLTYGKDIKILSPYEILKPILIDKVISYFNKSVDRHINLTNRLLRRFFRGLSNDLENVLNSLLCVTISSNNPC